MWLFKHLKDVDPDSHVYDIAHRLGQLTEHESAKRRPASASGGRTWTSSSRSAAALEPRRSRLAAAFHKDMRAKWTHA